MVRLLSSVLIVLCLAGCATNATRMTDISNGMTREEVVKALGAPSSVNAKGDQVLLIYTMFNGWSAYTWQSNYYVLLKNDHVVSYGNVKDSSVTPNDQGNFSYVLQPAESAQKNGATAASAGASANAPSSTPSTQASATNTASPTTSSVALAQAVSSSASTSSAASSTSPSQSATTGNSSSSQDLAAKFSSAAAADGDITSMMETPLVSVVAVQMAYQVVNPAVSSLMGGSQKEEGSAPASTADASSSGNTAVDSAATQSAEQVTGAASSTQATSGTQSASQGSSSNSSGSNCSSFGSYSYCDK